MKEGEQVKKRWFGVGPVFLILCCLLCLILLYHFMNEKKEQEVQAVVTELTDGFYDSIIAQGYYPIERVMENAGYTKLDNMCYQKKIGITRFE